MLALNIYRSTKEMPLPLYYQAETFVRILWADDEDYDMDAGLEEPSIHFTLSNGNTLISYASLIWRDIEHKSSSYKCFGLRSVLTFPGSRRCGFGGQIVQSATDFIRNETDADIALLWCEDQHQAFYERYSWQAMPDLTILSGDPNAPEIYDKEMPMMLFLSERGNAGRKSIEKGELYVGWESW